MLGQCMSEYYQTDPRQKEQIVRERRRWLHLGTRGRGFFREVLTQGFCKSLLYKVDDIFREDRPYKSLILRYFIFKLSKIS